jgi:predicted acylesterase/phospholipase RssA
MPPVPIQVVFQGGGAKICVLMAACEVLQKFQADQRIQITRVAGSSAGAIAAAMLGSGKPISEYKFPLQTLATKHLPLMKVSRLKGAWRIYWGHAWFAIDLPTLFYELFSKNGGPKYVSELTPHTEIYVTDLYALRSKPVSPNDSLSQALSKSCNFPFAFIGPGSDQIEVDGGLALNLPVDNMYRNRTVDGEVIAISFDYEFTVRKGNPLMSFSQNLFSAAVQSGVERSKSLVGEQNVFCIPTDIDTFDFHRILGDGLTTHYKQAYDEFHKQFDKWLAPYEKTPQNYSSRFVRATVGDLRPAIVQQIDEDLKSSSRVKGKTIFVSDIAIIDNSGAFTGRYRTHFAMSLEIIKLTYVLQLDLEIGSRGSFSDAHLLCAASSSRGEIPFTPRVQELNADGGELRSFRLYYYFDSPLIPTPGEVIAIQYQYEADDPYPKFGSDKDVSAMMPKLGDVDVITMVVAFPKSRMTRKPVTPDLASLSEEDRQAFGVPGWMTPLVATEEVNFPEIANQINLDRTLNEYHLVARRAYNVKKGGGCGFGIE